MAVVIDLQRLIAFLDPICRRALEAAAGSALSRTHYSVEVEHWFQHILQADRSDVSLILNHEGIDRGRFSAGLNTTLDRLSTGNGRSPSLAPELVSLLKDAWLIASVDCGERVLRSGHILCACLADEIIAARLRTCEPELKRLAAATLANTLPRLTTGSDEEPASDPPATDKDHVVRQTATPALDRFTTDLTAQAQDGGFDPILGRDREIRQVVDILSRRRQNNPILTGEAGVGKTAVVEGLALRIAQGDVPDALRDVSIRTLDLGLLQAGAGVKGEFENRLRSVIDEAQNTTTPVVLFIDEAHTLIGAGGQAGQGDAANLLKPPLARGELRVIAATTWAEYKRYFEKDAALTRRFQTVKVDEPSVPVTCDMLRGLAPVFEAHHAVRILDEAIIAAAALSDRYIPERQLPDKAVSLLDTACARVAMSQVSTPEALEGQRRRLTAIENEESVLAREMLTGAAHTQRLALLQEEAATLRERLTEDEARYQKEKGLVTDLLHARQDAENGAENARSTALAVTHDLHALQGDRPMVHPVVDAQVIAEIIENWTGIPARRLRSDEIQRLLSLEDGLRERVVGQDHALKAVAEAIRVSRAGLTDPRKPVGVFLMVGTSGVGKTETATALADLLYGGAQSLTTINMTEFKEEHKVSLLMGSPPGYVGYGEGGVMTEAVRRRPHSVLLLDEFEKAHPGVQDIFFQVFDKGSMKDGEGRDIDFRNTIVIMTTNAGTPAIEALFADPETAPDAEGLTTALHDEMLKHFKAAFLGRVTMVPYLPLSQETRALIVNLQIGKVVRRVQTLYGVTLECDESARAILLARSASAATGARVIERIIATEILPMLAQHFLGTERQQETAPVHLLTYSPDGFRLTEKDI